MSTCSINRFFQLFHLSGQVPSQTEVVQMPEETELQLALRVLLDADPQKRSGNVQQAVAARTTTL
jgi:hypothetical protein